MSFMDSACTSDFMPELYRIGGRRVWESECSYGLISIGVFLFLLVLALLPKQLEGFIGWTWMTPRQRSTMRAALAPSVLLSGIGAYHHDFGLQLVGLLLCIVISTTWYFACRATRKNDEGRIK
jgi:hypothetical protein